MCKEQVKKDTKIINPRVFGILLFVPRQLSHTENMCVHRRMLKLHCGRGLRCLGECVCVCVCVIKGQRNAKTKIKASELTKTITALSGDKFIKKRKPAVLVCSDLADFCTLLWLTIQHDLVLM